MLPYPIIFINDGKSNPYFIPKLFATLYQKSIILFPAFDFNWDQDFLT